MFATDSRPPGPHLVFYQIKVKGDLPEKWSDWFGGLEITSEREPDSSKITTLQGAIQDQAELRGILIKLLDLNLVLISLYQIQPSRESSQISNK